MSYEIPDPNLLTIPKLKSVLTQEGFGDQLPAHQEKKGFYVELYRQHVVPLLEARNARSAASAGSRTPGPRASIATSSLGPAKERTAQTDFVDRRRTLHTLAPESTTTTAAASKTAAAAKPTQTAASRPATQTGPTTPAAKAGMPRRLFAPEQQQQQQESVIADRTPAPAPAATSRPSSSARPSTSTSSTASSSSSSSSGAGVGAILSPTSSASRRTTIASTTGAVSYPKVAKPAAADLGPDMRRIIASQHARRKTGGGGPGVVWLLLGVLALAAAVGVGLFMYGQLPSYLQDKPYFCDTSEHRQNPRDKPREPVPCVDCPLYGVCKDGRLVKCMRGYEVSGGVSCARDKDIARTIEFCKEAAHKALAVRAGEHQCGYAVPALPMAEPELRDILKQQVKDAAFFPWDEAKFNEAFLDMKKDLQRPLVHSSITLRTADGVATFDTADVQLPFACVLRQLALEYIWYIVGTTVALAVVARYLQQQRKKAQVEADVSVLVERAKEMLKARKKRGEDPTYATVIELRDVQFHEDPDLKRRYRTINETLPVWALAEKRLRADTRFKEFSQIVAGQQQQVFEFIGTIDDETAQNILSPARSRKSYPN